MFYLFNVGFEESGLKEILKENCIEYCVRARDARVQAGKSGSVLAFAGLPHVSTNKTSSKNYNIVLLKILLKDTKELNKVFLLPTNYVS